ncbi:L-aspartate oxidase [Solemya velum gill symbiont]|uniref:L-aspartate oxidase n=1 Tax=Solemya velum gill symbiont TaxID=2340 RepID=A0A1T2ICR1_SOVGS|nr:L-aspartate oxidase [Solemya velum gill symbiont]OOY34936.1 L-aspartate oxidase [Solemya velum gill symbiont]OOY40291.1 L-aspartate oxidase [Solemya velum gill symbiont]OOY44335.1 L-aspartate oxidase [Solemya velum gill symbiont]OOY47262.1 L-aspartate oxidase [Solemya velum gill symbiont]OOY51387.1 L-aspartate oxidase [Solemya velum gill symbiont]
MPSSRFNHDVLIIGSGAAGLSLALRLDQKLRIAVIAKRELEEGNTFYAQGGISAVLDEEDSIESHVRDTLVAGAGLCEESVVRDTVKRGPENIQWLLDNGVRFTREDEQDPRSEFHLTREGGHSHRRVIHSADSTGQEVELTLVSQAKKRDNIDLFEDHIAIDLITSSRGSKAKRILGCYILDVGNDRVETYAAPVVVLASGGANKAYLYTSNPDVTTGDGIAMAWRAGCRVANMEFIQFHPTCLFHPHAKSFLITEALRGEGATLHLPNGERFMPAFDERAELAPRDVVARAIDHEMKRLGADCVYLDITHKPASFIREHFPTIHERCLEFGIDITRERIPVVPAAHYTCGGVITDKAAHTDIPGLYAIGETAYTGLHGANRMASNSLLECLVFGQIAAQNIEKQIADIEPVGEIKPWDESRVSDSDERVVVSHNWDELRRFMWDYVGIVRSNKRLERAKRRANLLRHEIDEYYSNFRVNNDLLELRNLVEVSDLIIRSAQLRKESRGLHYTIDFPNKDKQQKKPTVLIPNNYYPVVEEE